MSGPLATAIDLLAALGEASDPLAWLVVVAFLSAALLEHHDREWARPVAVGSWVLFGAFWLSTVHHFAFVQKSIIEGVGTLLAVPACLSIAAALASGRDSLFVLSRSVAVAGAIYLPVQAVPFVRRLFVESLTVQVVAIVRLLGLDPQVVSGLTYEGVPIADKEYPYRSTLVFFADGEPLTFTVKTACTGVGSMAVFAGLIAAVRAPLDRKLRALAVSIPVIYLLNVARVVFIGVGFGAQLFQVFPDLVATVFGVGDGEMVLVSYYVADRVIAQSLSVLVLVGITWVVVKRLPEIVVVLEDTLYATTRREYDLRGALDLEAVRTDGGTGGRD